MQIWSGVVNLLDGTVEESFTYQQAAAEDFHHTFLVSPQYREGLRDGTLAYFWIDEHGEPMTMEGDLPTKVVRAIKTQLKGQNPQLTPIDTRGYGAPYCRKCGTDVEEVVVMPDDSIRCPGCGTIVEGVTKTDLAPVDDERMENPMPAGMRRVPFYTTELKNEEKARNPRAPATPKLRVPRYRVSLVREAGSIYVTALPITTPDMIARQMQKLFEDADREAFFVVCVDIRLQVIGVNLVSLGTLSASLVHPREVFKVAILLNAHGIICVHNHPSGELKPSFQDRDLTTRLIQAGKLLGIAVNDHIIVSHEGYFSFVEQGLIQ